MKPAVGLLLAWAIFWASSAGAEEADEFSKNVVARLEVGDWQAESASFKGYDYSPRIGCRMTTKGASLVQWRPRESSELEADWSLLRDERDQGDNFSVEWLKVDGVRYDVAELPWRLTDPPTADNIVVMFDRILLAVRRSPTEEWLPATYLTLSLLGARRFEVGFRYENDNEQIVHRSRIVSLKGFPEVAKWCGRELLRDRQDEDPVRELTK